MEEKRDEIARWHTQERGWRAIGYAKVFDRDGSEAIGRDIDNDNDPFDEIGAHTKGWNSKAIGLCLLGGYGAVATDSFDDHFTIQQDHALRDEIRQLRARFPSIKWVKGHNDFAAKGCPGFKVSDWYTLSKPKGDDFLSSKTNQAGMGTLVTTAAQVVAPVVTDNPTAQTAIAIALAMITVGFVGYIIYSRIQKQKRGIL